MHLKLSLCREESGATGRKLKVCPRSLMKTRRPQALLIKLEPYRLHAWHPERQILNSLFVWTISRDLITGERITPTDRDMLRSGGSHKEWIVFAGFTRNPTPSNTSIGQY